MKQKGVFPYSFVYNVQKLKIDKFPSKSNFYDKLNGVSNRDYKRAKTVLNVFNCRILGEYPNNYLKTDVLLLSNEFESFRVRCLNK